MVSRVGAWDELLSTCMEGEKSCKKMMMVHASGGLNVIGLDRKEKRLGLNFGPIGWAEMGLVSKEWAWVEGNGLRRCKGRNEQWLLQFCS